MIASSTICGSTLTASCAVLEMIENELSKRGSCKVSYLPGKGQAYVGWKWKDVLGTFGSIGGFGGNQSS